MNERTVLDLLLKHGLIDPASVEDPEGYDNYQTLTAAKALSADLLAQRAEAAPILKAQEHALACGNIALELQSALAMLTNACAEDGWPKTAEQMAPMNMARAAMNLKLGDMNSPRSEGK